MSTTRHPSYRPMTAEKLQPGDVIAPGVFSIYLTVEEVHGGGTDIVVASGHGQSQEYYPEEVVLVRRPEPPLGLAGVIAVGVGVVAFVVLVVWMIGALA